MSNLRLTFDQIEEVIKLPYLKLDESETRNLIWQKELLDSAMVRTQEGIFNIHVIGNMKSGKSTFINALLGQDILPNESAACTLVPVEINTATKQRQVSKVLKNGEMKPLRGTDLEHIFLEDIREYRKMLESGNSIDIERYLIEHSLFQNNGPKKKVWNVAEFLRFYKKIVRTKNNVQEVLMRIIDTPGPNEMKQFAEQLDLHNVISDCLKNSSLILFIVDMQYYKDEENKKLLESLVRLRPDLREQIVFVVNKMDRLAESKEVTVATTIDDIRSVIADWGFEGNMLVPVSSKKALLSRMVESSTTPHILGEQYKKDFNEVLPLIEKEINGEILAVKPKPEAYYEQLFAESNFQHIDLFFKQIKKDLSQSIKVSNEKLTQSINDRVVKFLQGQIQKLDFESSTSLIALSKERINDLREAQIQIRELSQEELSQDLLKGIDYEDIKRELEQADDFSRRFSSNYMPSYSTDWDEYRNDDYDYIDPDATIPGRDKEILEEHYQDVMDDAYSSLPNEVSILIQNATRIIQKNIVSHAKETQNFLNEIYKEAQVESRIPFSVFKSALIQEKYSPIRRPAPHLWIERSTRTKERLFFKGRGDIRYEQFRLKNGGSFREESKTQVKYLLNEAYHFVGNQLKKMVEDQILPFYKQQIEQISLEVEKQKEASKKSLIDLENKLKELEHQKSQLLIIIGDLQYVNENPVEENKQTKTSLSFLVRQLSKIPTK